MTDILEVDSDLGLGGSGIKIYRGAEAVNEKFRFWFEKISRGEVWGRPDKGNNLKKYQFRSPTEANFALMEMEIATELPDHLPVRILSIRCNPATAKDRFTRAQIVYQSLDTGEAGIFEGDIVKRRSV